MNKNIHIIPTQRLSKLGRFIDTGKLSLRTDDDIPRGENINIYITVDEEIKRYGEYYLDIDTNEVKTSFENMGKYLSNEKKIIITDNKDLIKDGVQAIDDEFLVWFVKNPSCERVEVNYDVFEKTGNISVWEYDIIIPQEEPEKETIEEAAIRLYPDNIIKLGNETSYNAASLKRKDFINGANVQKEQDKQALQTAINLLKQTTEYDVLDSWKEKVKELEKLL